MVPAELPSDDDETDHVQVSVKHPRDCSSIINESPPNTKRAKRSTEETTQQCITQITSPAPARTQVVSAHVFHCKQSKIPSYLDRAATSNPMSNRYSINLNWKLAVKTDSKEIHVKDGRSLSYLIEDIEYVKKRSKESAQQNGSAGLIASTVNVKTDKKPDNEANDEITADHHQFVGLVGVAASIIEILADDPTAVIAVGCPNGLNYSRLVVLLVRHLLLATGRKKSEALHITRQARIPANNQIALAWELVCSSGSPGSENKHATRKPYFLFVEECEQILDKYYCTKLST